MSTLDIVVLFLVFALGIKGFLRGFVKEVAGLAAIVGGIFISSRYASAFADFLSSVFNFQNSTSTGVLAFVVLFCAIWAGITLGASFLSKVVDLSGLGIADRALGFVASGGKIFLILSVILFALSSISLLKSKLEAYTADSAMYPFMRETGGFIMKLKPEDLNASVLTDKIKEEAMKEVGKEINTTVDKK